VRQLWSEYIFAHSLSHGFEILDSYHGKARVIAGGTDLILRLQGGDFLVKCVVDITRVGNLAKVTEEANRVYIGAAVTHSDAVSNRLIKGRIPLLAEASSHVGTPQVRNQGTVLGNIVNAQPAADTAIALLALDAEVCIASPEGERWEPIGDLYEGVGLSRVNSAREIATAVRCRPIQQGEGWAYLRMRGRNDFWLPTINIAVWISLNNGRIASSRIAVGPVSPCLFRARGAEGLINGSLISADLIDRVGIEVMREIDPRDSVLRGSRDFRKELARVWVRRALFQALGKAGVNLADC
jgi:carbon-monoxide dehydrogenase medium subunit